MLCWRCARRLALTPQLPRRPLSAAADSTKSCIRNPAWQRGRTANTGAPQRQFSGGRGAYRADGRNASSGGPSIFDELFPDDARKKPTKKGEDGSVADERDAPLQVTEADDGGLEKEATDPATAARYPIVPPPSPADDPTTVPEEVRQWLDDASSAGSRPARKPRGNEAGRPGNLSSAAEAKQPPTVLVLSGTTASLLPSDFFRIAPRARRDDDGSHGRRRNGSIRSSSGGGIDGWAAGRGGLYKVVQDRDPATLAPRGRYFLYFGTSAGALAYAQEARDLHYLARRALGLDGVGVASTAVNGGSTTSTADEAAAAALRNFTLVAPAARLDLAMEIPEPAPVTAEEVEGGVEDAANRGPFLTDDAPSSSTKVLLVLGGHGPDSSPTPSDGTTVDGVRRLLAADSAARNLPWAVSEGLNGVVPVAWVVAERRRQQQQQQQRKKLNKNRSNSNGDERLPDLVTKTDQMNEHARYTRFVVAFADAVEARRFVRMWHRRPVTLERRWRGRRLGEGIGQPAEEDVGRGSGPAAEPEPGLSAVLDATVLW